MSRTGSLRGWALRGNLPGRVCGMNMSATRAWRRFALFPAYIVCYVRCVLWLCFRASPCGCLLPRTVPAKSARAKSTKWHFVGSMPARTRASLLASLLCLCAALDVSHPCGRRPVRQARLRSGRTSRPVAAVGKKVRLTVDLGKDGEPKGETSVVFTPLLPRSVFVQVDLRVPLGMVIEETEKDDPYPGRVIVTGALPGYSANGKVLAGDFVRAAEIKPIATQAGTFHLQFSSQLRSARHPDDWQTNFSVILQRSELEALKALIDAAL